MSEFCGVWLITKGVRRKKITGKNNMILNHWGLPLIPVGVEVTDGMVGRGSRRGRRQLG